MAAKQVADQRIADQFNRAGNVTNARGTQLWTVGDVRAAQKSRRAETVALRKCANSEVAQQRAALREVRQPKDSAPARVQHSWSWMLCVTISVVVGAVTLLAFLGAMLAGDYIAGVIMLVVVVSAMTLLSWRRRAQAGRRGD